MSLAITILAAIVLGIFIGVFIVVVYMFIKTWWQNRKVLKKNPNIVEEIKLNKELNEKVKNVRIKKIKGIRERNRREHGFKLSETDAGTPTGELGTTATDKPIPDEDVVAERRRIQVSDVGFALRD